MENLKHWLCDISNDMQTETIISITGNHHYLTAFYAASHNKIGIKDQGEVHLNYPSI
jgi:hypothetical protein